MGLGCNLNPARQCTKDGDCASNATCHVDIHTCVVKPATDAGKDGGSGGVLDLAVVVPAMTARAPVPNAVVLNVSDTTSYLRSDSVAVKVTAFPKLPAGAVTFTVKGLGDAVESAPGAVSVVPCAAGLDAGYCGEAHVDLSAPKLNALRGSISVTVSAVYDGGTFPLTRDIPVTRVKWVEQLQAPLKATPAINNDGGIVYVASAAVDGKVVALKPDGTSAWAAAFDSGPVEASPAVGVNAVYFGQANATASSLFALDRNSGASLASCGKANGIPAKGPILASPVILRTNGTEGAVSVANEGTEGRLVTVKVEVGAGCEDVLGSTLAAFPATVVSDDMNIYFGNATGVLEAFHFDFSWAHAPIWSMGAQFAGGTDSALPGIGVTSIKVMGLAKPGAFSSATSGNASSATQLALGLTVKPGSASVDHDGNVYAGDAATHLWRVNAELPASAKSVAVGSPISAAPLLGQSGLVYSVDAAGALLVHDANLSAVWTSDGLSATGFSASPTIDCARDPQGNLTKGPGVLYLAGNDGRLLSILVDSKGLDTTALWPKYQHDSANTGNLNTKLVSCP